MASHDVLSGAVGNREGFEYLDVDASVRIGKNVKLLPPVSVASECEIDNGATIGGGFARGGGRRGGGGGGCGGRVRGAGGAGRGGGGGGGGGTRTAAAAWARG